MHRDELFLHTIADLRRRVERGPQDEYEAMGIAGLLRKLLLDSSPLVTQVNRGRRLKITYRTTLASSMSDSDYENGEIVPDLPPLFRASQLSRDRFLSRFACYLAPYEYTVKDLILYVANIKGAVHAGEPHSPQEEGLAVAGAQFRLAGHDPAVYAMFGIARTVLAALEPLRERVEQDRAAS